jgi:hypothetical protein
MMLQPPPGSCIEADYDEEGRPRLTWRQPYVLRERLASYPWGTFLLLAVMAVIAVQGFFMELDRVRHHAQGKGWLAALGHAAFPGAIVVLPVLMFLSLFLVAVAVLLSRPCPERITFGPHALAHEPCGFFPWWRKARQVPRDEIGSVRPERVAGMWRLTLDHGVDRVKIGLFLPEAELNWLANVLGSWAASGAPATSAGAFPPLPKGSSIRIEPDDLGTWRLYWLPRSSPKFRRFHQGCLVGVLCFVVFGMLLVVPHLVQFFGGLPRLFRMGLGGAIFGCVVAALLLGVTARAHRQLMGIARILYGQLRQPLRPEAITLTPSGLHYEPGNSLLTVGNEAGPCQAAHMEAPEYGKQRLFLVRDGRRFEIGPGLTGPEREWLAEVLHQRVERGGLALAARSGQAPVAGDREEP